MARSADAATAVLDSLQVLYDLGDQVDVTDVDVVAALESIGVTGVPEDYAPFLSVTGTLLRLMLRHSDVAAETLFAAARDDLRILARDIEDQAFDALVQHLSEQD